MKTDIERYKTTIYSLYNCSKLLNHWLFYLISPLFVIKIVDYMFTGVHEHLFQWQLATSTFEISAYFTTEMDSHH